MFHLINSPATGTWFTQHFSNCCQDAKTNQRFSFLKSVRVVCNLFLRPWFFYYSFYGSADRLYWGFGKKIKLLLHTFFILADSRS